MRNEYNVNGYAGVVKKFNYKACKDKLLTLFKRHKLEWRKEKIIYNLCLLQNAIKIIKNKGWKAY